MLACKSTVPVKGCDGFLYLQVIAIAIVWTICFTARAILLVLLAYDNQDLEKKVRS